MPSIGTPAQRPAFPPVREILPRAGDSGVTAIPGHGNAAGQTIPASLFRHRPGRPVQEVPMKIARWIAAAALTLISLMDVGSALGGGGNSAAVRVLAPLLGLLGLAAVYGMLRWRPWGAPAALAASAVNVVSALIAMAVSSAGALAGLAVSLIALALTAVAARASRTSQPHAPAS
jgi:hypothetical protein